MNRRLLSLALFLGLGHAQVAYADTLRADRVVVMMRHGVRPPTAAVPLPPGVAPDRWPSWPVPPGWLTPHGALEVKRIAAADRIAFARAGIVPRAGCGANAGSTIIRVLSDGSDQRTVVTGDAYIAGFAPDCGIANEHAPDRGKPDPLYAPITLGLTMFDPRRADRAIAEATDPADRAAMLASARPAIARMSRILCGTATIACGIGDVPLIAIRPATSTKRPGTVGSFDDAVTGAQALLLEYADGKPMREVGWGRASAADIDAVSILHAMEARLVIRPPYIAAKIMAGLGDVIRSALAGNGPAVTLLSGHDTNVSALGGLLDLHWKVPGVAADEVPPGSAILLERLRDARGRFYVRAVYRSLSLRGIRTLAAGVSPIRSVLPIPGCSARGVAGLCTMADFQTKLDAALAAS